jgi:integrase
MVAVPNVIHRSSKVRQIRTVWSDIETFLKDCSMKSENTAATYRTAIRDFFLYACDKAIQQLTADDLQFEYSDILDYRTYLLEEKEMKAGSVNTKMAAIKAVMAFLARHTRYSFINIDTFTVDKLKGEVDSYGNLSFDEAMQFVMAVKAQEKGEEKSLLFEMATFTSIRRDALLALEWRHFEVKDNKVIITTLDKGRKEDRKPISIDLYNRLLTLKRAGQTKVFTLTRKTANRAVRTVCEQLGIDDERNIVLHSFKKVAINWILQNEGDVIKAARQGNHGVDTMSKYYAKTMEDFDSMAGMNMGKSIDISVLTTMTAEQLVMLIEKASNSTKLELLMLTK